LDGTPHITPTEVTLSRPVTAFILYTRQRYRTNERIERERRRSRRKTNRNLTGKWNDWFYLQNKTKTNKNKNKYKTKQKQNKTKKKQNKTNQNQNKTKQKQKQNKKQTENKTKQNKTNTKQNKQAPIQEPSGRNIQKVKRQGTEVSNVGLVWVLAWFWFWFNWLGALVWFALL